MFVDLEMPSVKIKKEEEKKLGSSNKKMTKLYSKTKKRYEDEDKIFSDQTYDDHPKTCMKLTKEYYLKYIIKHDDLDKIQEYHKKLRLPLQLDGKYLDDYITPYQVNTFKWFMTDFEIRNKYRRPTSLPRVEIEVAAISTARFPEA